MTDFSAESVPPTLLDPELTTQVNLTIALSSIGESVDEVRLKYKYQQDEVKQQIRAVDGLWDFSKDALYPPSAQDYTAGAQHESITRIDLIDASYGRARQQRNKRIARNAVINRIIGLQVAVAED